MSWKRVMLALTVMISAGTVAALPSSVDAAIRVTAKELADDPAKFEAVEVEIEGTVTRKIDADDYMLMDPTGEIRIDIQPGVPLPTVGTTITLVGTYYNGANGSAPEINVNSWTAPAPPEPPVPPTAPVRVTAKEINDNPAKYEGVAVEIDGVVTRRIDDDDYAFSDHTGEVRIDIQSGVPHPPIGIMITLVGTYSQPEINVVSWKEPGGGPGLPDEVVKVTTKQINDDPAKYEGAAVEIDGVISKQIDAHNFKLADHTGEIKINTQTGVPSPPVGVAMTVIGIYIQPEVKVYLWEVQNFGPLGPSERLCFPVAGSPGDVALVNLTPVEAVGAGNGQLISSDVATPPLASNVNFGPGTADPNVAAAPIGADGKVCFANSKHTTVHLIADHLGSIKSTAYQLATSTGAPDRKIDTRSSGTPLAPSARLCFPVAGSPGDVALVNLTPVEAQGAGNGQLISSDVETPPLASNVNFGPGTADPNVAAAPIGADGKVCFANSKHTTVHLIADHLGSIKSTAYQLATSTGAPDRKIDTRSSGTPLAPSARLCFPVAGSPGDVALVNLTPVEAVGAGNGQLISSDVATPPLASNVNFGPGTADPNVAAAPIGADGKVCFANSKHTTVHLIADHLGSIKSTAYQLATSTGAPDRKIDTRNSA